MTEVLLARRKAAVLAPSQLACLAKIPTVNLTAGCAHNCVYCYARSYSQNPGRGRITLYANTLEMLRAELPRKRKRPPAVYFSPSSDAFQPVPQVLELTYKIFEFLLAQRVGVAFLTKGKIPDRHMNLLKAHAPNVHAGIGLTTRDERISRAFEPGAAPPEARVAQIAALRQAGIDTQVRLDPILPGLTDDEETLNAVFATLGRLDVRDVAISTAFIRPSIARNVRHHVHDKKLAETFLRHYNPGAKLTMHGAGTSVTMPPAATRKAIYQRVRRLAGRYGIAIKICTCKNGDLATDSCHIAGNPSGKSHEPEQRTLF
ncbi:MAG: radical SAM protein [Phycisphaerae bacterium]|jgi:DNA repair photolyase|nr:radical SAM protein [Phycisphaerae bacterium]